jgi:ketosteroid isomerase-like protein
MTLRLAVVVFCALAVLASHVVQGSSASAVSNAGRQADLAGIEKFHQRDIAATLSRDPVALTDLWTDDAVRLRSGQPPELGKKAIQESNQRWAALPSVKVVSYGGEVKQIRGTRLMVLKKMRDGSWKCFRGMGGPTFTAPLAGKVVEGPAASTGSVTGGSAADSAGIEKLRQQDVAATFSRDPVSLTAYYTDDAVRLGPVPPAEVGKQVIFESNQRLTANKDFKVLSYVPEYKELIFLDGGWAVEWRPFTGSFITSPGGAPVHARGMVLIVYKKLPDGNWKCFRGAGIGN